MTLQQWLDQWRYKSRDVQDRVQIALEFMQKHYGATSANTILSQMQCIDFSRSVQLPRIPVNTRLVGFKDPRVPPDRSAYFTKSGYPVYRLGTSPNGAVDEDPEVLPKTLYRYVVLVAIPVGEVLQSTCAPAADERSIKGRKIQAAGGGLQYLIPNMKRYLKHLP